MVYTLEIELAIAIIRSMPLPAPFQSTLWKHLTQIRRMRRQHKTWNQIAHELKVEVKPRAVRNFFVRTQNLKKVPVGFEHLLPRLEEKRRKFTKVEVETKKDFLILQSTND